MYLYLGNVFSMWNVVLKKYICMLVVDVGIVIICIMICMLCSVLFCECVSVCCLLCSSYFLNLPAFLFLFWSSLTYIRRYTRTRTHKNKKYEKREGKKEDLTTISKAQSVT